MVETVSSTLAGMDGLRCEALRSAVKVAEVTLGDVVGLSPLEVAAEVLLVADEFEQWLSGAPVVSSRRVEVWESEG